MIHIPTIFEFKTIYLDEEHHKGYYSYKTNEFELCLEPCLNGFDVALYDQKEDLVYPKECTNLDTSKWTINSLKIFAEALKIYRFMLMKYESDHRGKNELSGL